jgi:putative membrane protein
MRRFGVTVLAGALLALASAALAQDPAPPSKTNKGNADRMKSDTGGSADSRFMMKAAEGGMAEVQMGNLAKDRASSDAVKQFGQRMVDDHTKAGDELKSLASQKNVTLPTDVDAETKTVMDHLQTLNGAAFDQAYMSHMVSDHKEDVSEFQREASSGRDADVKAWAAKTLPTLQDHLKQAQEVNSKLGK